MQATISVWDAVGRERLVYRISKERWLLLETLTFVPFLPQDNAYLDNESVEKQMEDSETALNWNKKLCEQLISFPFDQFWCHMLYNHSLQRFLSDFCRFRRPYYDDSPKSRYCWMDKLVYDIFYRASSPQDCLSDDCVDVSTVFCRLWEGQVSELLNISLIWDWFGIFPCVTKYLVSRIFHFCSLEKEWWNGTCLEAWSVACDAVETNPAYVLHILDSLRGIYCFVLRKECSNGEEERDEAIDILFSMMDHLWQRIWNSSVCFPYIVEVGGCLLSIFYCQSSREQLENRKQRLSPALYKWLMMEEE